MRLLHSFAPIALIGFFSGCISQSPQNVQPVKPRTVGTIEFAGTNLTGTVPKPQLTFWWTTKLKIASEAMDAYEFLTLSTNGQDKRIRVENCQQYTKAIAQGAYALTTFDMTMESWFQRATGTLKFMETAQPSTRRLPTDLLTQLPVSLLGWHGSDEEAQIKEDTRKGMTLLDYARTGRVKKLKRKQNNISFQTEGQDFWVEELACGDVDGDGSEDALIFVTWHYQGGSGRGYHLKVVSKPAGVPRIQAREFDLR